MLSPDASASFPLPFPLDLDLTLGPLQRGPSDPTIRFVIQPNDYAQAPERHLSLLFRVFDLVAASKWQAGIRSVTCSKALRSQELFGWFGQVKKLQVAFVFNQIFDLLS